MRGRNPTAEEKRYMAAVATCKAVSCDSKIKAKGLCVKHYTRLIRYGDYNKCDVVINDDKRRLEANSEKDIETGCWNWKKHKKNGYGHTGYKGKSAIAHRVSWIVHFGEIPDGKQINHKCHNRACINPEHLYVGTQKQNMQDMRYAGREVKASGSKNGNSRLIESDVVKIKKMLSSGATQTAIAKDFGVAITTISSIKTGRTWGYI